MAIALSAARASAEGCEAQTDPNSISLGGTYYGSSLILQPQITKEGNIEVASDVAIARAVKDAAAASIIDEEQKAHGDLEQRGQQHLQVSCELAAPDSNPQTTAQKVCSTLETITVSQRNMLLEVYAIIRRAQENSRILLQEYLHRNSNPPEAQ